jgi:N-acetylglucosaminyl-diphospho-decaprenol L-rhamnosyltransferase
MSLPDSDSSRTSLDIGPTVTAVVVTWNSASTIGTCVATLQQSLVPGGVHIVVVDNASSDATIDEVMRAGPAATVIRNRSNVGLAAANNQGIAVAESPWLLISNPDVIYERSTIDELIACANRHPRAAFVIPRLSYADGSLQTSVGDLPTCAQAMRGRRVSAARAATAGVWWDGWAHDEERQVGHGAESCYLVRKAAIDAAGPQDPRYFLDWEGIDWAERMRAAGWEVWFTPHAHAIHVEGVSIRQVKFRWVVRTHRGMYRYFAQRSQAWMRPALAALVILRAAVKLAAFAVRVLVERSRRP